MTDGVRVPQTVETLVREDVEQVLGAADLPLGSWVSKHAAELEQCVPAARCSLMLRFAVTWLLANGLIVTAPDGAFENWFPVDLEEPFAGDVAVKLREYVTRSAKLRAAVV